MSFDIIQLEVVHNALRSIVDEGYLALMRSAYSSNIKERHDHSAALFDAGGRLVAQTERNIPMHLGSMTGFVKAVLERFPLESIKPGDIFVANDPFLAGGTHLPDIGYGIPVFADGKVIAFACNVAHHADIGGMAPGGMDGRASEIYHEGLRIPPIRLARAGVLDTDLLNLFLANVRISDERRGDHFAQIAACRLCERRLLELMERYPADHLLACFDELIERTELRMKAALAKITPGTYTFEDVMDDDGHGATDIPMRVAVTVSPDRIIVDFDGTAPQVKGNINVPFSATLAAVGYAVKAMLDPKSPSNAGFFNVIEINAPTGTLVNARFPAAIANRQQTCQRIADMLVGALSKAMPEAGVAASHGATVMAFFSSATDAEKPYIYLEVIAGGSGGRFARDGKDGAAVHTTNTSNLPVEVIETEYPLIVESYGFIPDTGGPGRNRGGLALRRVVRVLTEGSTFTGHAERFMNKPWGMFGGGAGASGSYRIIRSDGEEVQLSPKAAGIPLHVGDRVVIESPGAGGYGPPGERDAKRLRADYASGKTTLDFIRANYPAALVAAAGLTPADPAA
ncbi:MAG: hydantoinase B/oxoprolinase family protein [Hyphomicrobiaceae bacterium]